MFISCRNLVSIDDISNWGLSNVTNMSTVFQDTLALKSVGGSGNWNLNKVTNMSSAFQNTGLEYLDASNWELEVITDFDISNIDFTSATITDRMFADIPTINGNLNFNRTKVTNYSNMFTMQSRINDPDFHRKNPIIINLYRGE